LILNWFKWFIDSMKAIYNSRILPLEKISLEIHNRAFCYGDGLFETIVTGPERISLTHYHMARLTKASALLHIQIPFEAELLEKMMEQLKKVNKTEGECRFRLQVWRSSGGLYEPIQNSSEFLLTCDATSYPFYGSIDSLGISKNAKVTHHKLSFAKTMSAMIYVVAGLERKQTDYDDLIITNGQDQVAESISSNIFWLKDDIVYTPALASGCVEGTMRCFLIESLSEQGRSVEEVMASKEVLTDADAIFLSNAAGIRWVKQFEGKKYENPAEYLRSHITPPLPL